MRKPDRPKSGVMFRCAIYTRKSSDDGLEQEFNSLDAQREACEAYVTSQRHAGWIALPEMYDDGGLSGGTIERPALQRLLSGIKAGPINLGARKTPAASHRGFDRSGSPHRSCHAITVRLVPIAQEPAPVTRTRLFNDRFKRALPTGTYAVIWSWGRFNFTGS
jgi:hypothetical protein